MLKKRLIALGLLILAVGIGYFVYWSQVTGKKPFKLGLDLSGGSYLVYRADVSKVADGQVGDAMDALRDVIERRVNLFGVSEPHITTETANLSGTREHRLVVELPGVTDTQKAIAMIGQTPLLEFKIEGGEDGSEYISTELTGQYLSRATLQFDQQTNSPIIGLQFDSEGAKLFEEMTGENIGKTIAIYLDGAVISAPRVNGKIIGGQAVITGTFTPTEAKILVGRLNSGALPVPVELIATDSIGPTLGADAVVAGIIAGLIGAIIIAVLLIIWYRVPGLIATVSLSVYAILMLALFKLIPVTLTSAGIAGFIISLGMAVDANILIFERMKEELRDGNNLPDSIRHGFDRAWNSIRDGNVSSIISAIILFWFGTTLIQGFALTFGIGVLVSMITAITVTRIFLYAVAGKNSGRIKRFLFSSGFTK